MTATEQKLRQGIAALKAGRREEARQLLAQVLEREEANEEAWLWMSAAVSTDKQRRMCLRKVLDVNPKNVYAMRGLRYLRDAKEGQKAAGILELVDQQTSVSNREELQEAMAYLEAGNREAARRTLRPVIRSEPQDETAWLLLSRTFDDLDLRRNCLKRVIEINPANQEARKQLELLNTGTAGGFQAGKPTSAEAVMAPEKKKTETDGSKKYRGTRIWVTIVLAAILGFLPCMLALSLTGYLEPSPSEETSESEKARVARLCCIGCAEEGILINLWEHPARNPDGSPFSDRGDIVGKVPHNTLVSITKRVWSEGEERYYFYARADDDEGWIPESFVEWGNETCSQEFLEPYLTREPTPQQDGSGG